MIQEVPQREKRADRSSSKALSGFQPPSYLLNPMSHKIIIERAKSAPKMDREKISGSSSIIIEGTAVLLEEALKRLADK